MNDPADKPVDPKRTTRRYSRLVGIVFFAFVVFIVLRTIGDNESAGTGLARGDAAPKFAAPSAAGNLVGDANVFQTTEQARRAGDETAACDVELDDAIRVCDYWKAKPLVLVIWSTKASGSDRQVDQAQRLRGKYPGVNFIALDTISTLGEAKKRVASNGWTLPVAVDPDGAVSAIYNVALPPATFFVFPGGKIQHTALGRISEQVLDEDIRRLVKDSRERDANTSDAARSR